MNRKDEAIRLAALYTSWAAQETDPDKLVIFLKGALSATTRAIAESRQK